MRISFLIDNPSLYEGLRFPDGVTSSIEPLDLAFDAAGYLVAIAVVLFGARMLRRLHDWRRGGVDWGLLERTNWCAGGTMQEVAWKAGLWDVGWDELGGDHSKVGMCSFDPGAGARLEIPYGDITEERALAKDGFYVQSIEEAHYGEMCGVTQDGLRLVLANVVSNGVGMSAPGNTCESFRATTVFCSRSEFDPKSPVTSLDFELEGLREWLELRYNPGKDGDEVTIDFGDAKRSMFLFETAGTRAELQYGVRGMQCSTEGINFPLCCYVHLDVLGERAFEEVWGDEVSRLCGAFAFFWGSYPSVSWLTLRLRGVTHEVSVYRASAQTRGFPKVGAPVGYSAVAADGARAVQRWMDMADDERYATDLLALLLRPWSMPLQSQLMQTNAMLEALVRRGHESEYTKREFKRLTAPLMAAVNKCDDEDFKNRARGILGMLMRPSYKMLLDYAHKEAGPWGDDLICDWDRFKREQCDLRNKGAHGLPGERSIELSVLHYYAQILLAYPIVMKRLGFSDEAVNAMVRSNFMNAARWRVQKEYEVKADGPANGQR